MTKTGKNVPMVNGDKQHIYEHCGDHRVRAKVRGRKGGHFVDPLLKLYYHAHLMLVTNDDVPNGHANGTGVLLEAVVVEDYFAPHHLIIDGLKCPAVEASQVDHLLCSSESDGTKLFNIHPKSLHATVKVPVPHDIGGSAKATVNFSVALVNTTSSCREQCNHWAQASGTNQGTTCCFSVVHQEKLELCGSVQSQDKGRP